MNIKITAFIIALLLSISAFASQTAAINSSVPLTTETSQLDVSFDIIQSEAISTENNCESTIDGFTGDVLLAQVSMITHIAPFEDRLKGAT